MTDDVCKSPRPGWPRRGHFLRFGAVSAQAQEVQITIDNFTFSPAEMKVKVGDTVTWTNHDDIPHTVVSAGKFRSKTMDTDDKYLVHLHLRGRLQVFLFVAPAHDRNDQG